MVYLFSLLIPGLIWFLSTAFSGIFPFGQNTILTSDMMYQYIGYFEFIQNILQNGVDAFYSFSKGLGEETLGMISYYMASPFNLIVGLFPKENITEAILLINLLKIAASGLTFSIFIKNKFKEKKLSNFIVLAFSICYALMSYNIVYQFNIMWLDAVIWLPLIILGVDRIIKSGKTELFYISLTITLISNWYIGFMVCVFSGLYVVYCLSLVKDTKVIKCTLIKFILFGILSAGTALVVIVPAAFTCFNELSRDQMTGSGVVNYKLIDILSKFVLGAFSFEQITDLDHSSEYLNLPNLFSGTIVVFLFILYFFNTAFDKKEKIRDGIFGIVLIIMTLFVPLNKVWHAFTYNVWFPYRYSFCLIFYMIFIACKSFSNIDSMELKKIWKIVLGILGIYFIIEKLDYSYIQSEMIYCSIFIMIALYIGIKLTRTEVKKYSYLLIALVVCIECFLNTIVYISAFDYQDRDKFYSARANLSEKLSEINREDKGVYRVETNITKDYNTAMGYNYMGMTNSSSMGNESVRGFLESLGYTRISNNKVEYEETTKFANNFLGIKYYIDDEFKRNNDALSLGFLVNDSVQNIKDFTTEWGSHKNSFEMQNILVSEATGIKEQLYKSIDIYDLKIENLEEIEDNHYSKIHSGVGASYAFKFNVENENTVYLKVNGNVLENTNLYLNGEKITKYMVTENYSIINLGKFKIGDTVDIKLDFVYDNYIEIYDVWLYYEDIDVYNDVMEILKKGELNINKISGATIDGKINVDKDDQLLLFTLPYDKNLKICVDGKESESIKVLDSLISTPITRGEHIIKVCYVPKHLYVSAIMSVMFLIIAIVMICFEYKDRKNITE